MEKTIDDVNFKQIIAVIETMKYCQESDIDLKVKDMDLDNLFALFELLPKDMLWGQITHFKLKQAIQNETPSN
jgi:hypothetical protein